MKAVSRRSGNFAALNQQHAEVPRTPFHKEYCKSDRRCRDAFRTGQYFRLNVTSGGPAGFLPFRFIVVRQLVCHILPAPVALVDPASLVKEIAIGLDKDPVCKINIGDLHSYVQRQLILLQIFFFRGFFGIGDAGLHREP